MMRNLAIREWSRAASKKDQQIASLQRPQYNVHRRGDAQVGGGSHFPIRRAGMSGGASPRYLVRRTTMDEPMEFDPTYAVDAYRRIIARWDRATTPEERRECEKITVWLRRRWSSRTAVWKLRLHSFAHRVSARTFAEIRD